MFGEYMRVRLHNHPLLQSLLLSTVLCMSTLATQPVTAEVLSIPLTRDIATQPITTLEIVAMVKSLLSGRVLSVKKQSSYTNPDCHYVKFLEDKGEFQMIKVACFVDNVVLSN